MASGGSNTTASNMPILIWIPKVQTFTVTYNLKFSISGKAKDDWPNKIFLKKKNGKFGKHVVKDKLRIPNRS
jgi:hypothetical protein